MRSGRLVIKGLSNKEKSQIRYEKATKKQIIEAEQKVQRELAPKKIVTKTSEFLYIDEVPKEKLEGKHIFIDPGKRCLLTMMNDNGEYLSYTNRQRLKETKRFEYQDVIQKCRNRLTITQKEKVLAKYNSKTCSIDKFKDYMTAKIAVNEMVWILYRDRKFRQYKWYAYINRKRAEDRMLNLIENKFGLDCSIIIGDWSIGKQMRHFISTPNLSIKRKLTERFSVYNIDEYRTSCLNYRTEKRCSNLYLPDAGGVMHKKHSILTFQMEPSKRMGCLNRDKNGTKNIQKLFESFVKTGLRPLRYCRGFKIEDSK
jgi:hypothetical protein